MPRLNPRPAPTRLCHCGCGAGVRPTADYLRGHNMRHAWSIVRTQMVHLRAGSITDTRHAFDPLTSQAMRTYAARMYAAQVTRYQNATAPAELFPERGTVRVGANTFPALREPDGTVVYNPRPQGVRDSTRITRAHSFIARSFLAA